MRLVYNPSDGAPRSWSRIGHLAPAKFPQVGCIVLATVPAEAAALAAQRGYLSAGVPIPKRIAAVAPQAVCVGEHVVRIDGAAVAILRAFDGMQRPLPVW